MSLKWNQVAAAFLIGLLVGALAGGSPFFRNLDRRFDNKPPEDRMLKRFAKRLDLTVEQKDQAKAVFDQKRAKMDAIFEEMKPKFEQVRTETSDEIRKFLNPEQQQKFEKLEAEMSKKFKNRRPPPHP